MPAQSLPWQGSLFSSFNPSLFTINLLCRGVLPCERCGAVPVFWHTLTLEMVSRGGGRVKERPKLQTGVPAEGGQLSRPITVDEGDVVLYGFF